MATTGRASESISKVVKTAPTTSRRPWAVARLKAERTATNLWIRLFWSDWELDESKPAIAAWDSSTLGCFAGLEAGAESSEDLLFRAQDGWSNYVVISEHKLGDWIKMNSYVSLQFPKISGQEITSRANEGNTFFDSCVPPITKVGTTSLGM